MASRRQLKITSTDYDLSGVYIPSGSDRRVTGGVEGTCALCEKNRVLRLSHIVPRWMYKWAKAEGTIVGNYKTLGIRTAEADGRKHYLLCDACEQFLGEAESYVAILQDESRNRDRELRGLNFHDDESISGLDFDLTLRFLAGIAFKAHQVDSAPYHTVRFSEAYITDCKRILSGEMPVRPFAFLAMRFHSKVATDIDPRAMVYLHKNYFRDMGESLVLLAGGWEWLLIRYKGSISQWPELFRDMVIQRDQSAVVPWGEITDHRFLNP